MEDAAGRMSNPPENTAVEGRMVPSLLLEGPEQARRQAALMVSDLLQPGLKLVFCGYNHRLDRDVAEHSARSACIRSWRTPRQDLRVHASLGFKCLM